MPLSFPRDFPPPPPLEFRSGGWGIFPASPPFLSLPLSLDKSDAKMACYDTTQNSTLSNSLFTAPRHKGGLILVPSTFAVRAIFANLRNGGTVFANLRNGGAVKIDTALGQSKVLCF